MAYLLPLLFPYHTGHTVCHTDKASAWLLPFFFLKAAWFVFICQNWGWTAGLHTCQPTVLPLSCHTSRPLYISILRVSSCSPGCGQTCVPPSQSLSSWVYRHSRISSYHTQQKSLSLFCDIIFCPCLGLAVVVRPLPFSLSTPIETQKLRSMHSWHIFWGKQSKRKRFSAKI